MSLKRLPVRHSEYEGEYDQAAAMVVQSLLKQDLDQCLNRAHCLKNGNSATVVEMDSLVIKRYNNKSTWHAIKRRLKPTRAYRSWHSAHRLLAHGFHTPKPIAFLDRRARFPWLRGTSFYIAKFHSSPSIIEMPDEQLIANEIGEHLARLLQRMRENQLVHGDFKASNFLWENQQLVMIDLDAMRWDLSSHAFVKAHQKDIARLKANWPHGAFREHLDTLILP